MGAIKRLQTHAGKSQSLEMIETEFVLSEAEENERIKRLSKNILKAFRFLESRGKRGTVPDPRVDEVGSIFEEVSQDLEKRIGK
jgi:hypothetical protein